MDKRIQSCTTAAETLGGYGLRLPCGALTGLSVSLADPYALVWKCQDTANEVGLHAGSLPSVRLRPLPWQRQENMRKQRSPVRRRLLGRAFVFGVKHGDVGKE